MKKIFSLALALFAMMSMSAATLNLDLAEAGSTGWGGVEYNATTHVMTFPVAWEGGSGWWIAADWSAYERVVVEFEKAPCKIQLVVEYGDENTSNGYESALVPAGEKMVELALNSAKKNAVQKVYLQAEAPCSLTLTAAYATSDQAVDPLDGKTGVAVGEMVEPNKTCYLSLAEIKEYDYFEVLITNTNSTAENGWGIGKIVAASNWSGTVAFEFLCNNPGQGNVNRYVIPQADMLEYAKVNGTYYTDEYGQQGVHINVYDDKASLTSVKGFKTGDTPVNPTQKTDLGTPDEYGVVYLDLATINKYDEFEVVINVTDAGVGKGWGVGKIVPVNKWDGPAFELKSVKEGAVENTITVSKADMLEAAKVDGSFYKDEYDRQGVMVNAYSDKAQLVVVRGIGGTSAVNNAVEASNIDFVGNNIYRAQSGITVYNITGASVLAGEEVDLNVLPQGMYILRAGSQSLKVRR